MSEELPSLEQPTFAEIARLIQDSRTRAFQAVNEQLIELYWEVGKIISQKIESAEWGQGVVDELVIYLKRNEPGLKGFSRRNLYLMRQFYATYREHEFVHALRAQLPWTHHRLILAQSKSPEEREFYLKMAIREKWSSRELERQFRLASFEKAILSPPKVSAALRGCLKMAGTVLRNGPANGRSMNPPMKRLKIYPWPIMRLPFSRTARRSVPAFAFSRLTLRQFIPKQETSSKASTWWNSSTSLKVIPNKTSTPRIRELRTIVHLGVRS